MTDTQILENVKKIIDACFAAGMVKRLEDVKQMVELYDSLTERLTKQNFT